MRVSAPLGCAAKMSVREIAQYVPVIVGGSELPSP